MRVSTALGRPPGAASDPGPAGEALLLAGARGYVMSVSAGNTSIHCAMRPAVSTVRTDTNGAKIRIVSSEIIGVSARFRSGFVLILAPFVTVTYSDQSEETVFAGELFYWPPGHSVRVGADAELILFSPQIEHCRVVNHLKKQLSA